MPLLTPFDLPSLYYSWSALPGDDPQVTEEPDRALLNRREGYEVLDFINNLAVIYNWKQKTTGLKAESLIRNHLPGYIRSRAHIHDWLVDNWSKYPDDLFNQRCRPSLKVAAQAFSHSPSLKDRAQQQDATLEVRRSLGPVQPPSLGLKDLVRTR